MCSNHCNTSKCHCALTMRRGGLRGEAMSREATGAAAEPSCLHKAPLVGLREVCKLAHAVIQVWPLHSSRPVAQRRPIPCGMSARRVNTRMQILRESWECPRTMLFNSISKAHAQVLEHFHVQSHPPIPASTCAAAGTALMQLPHTAHSQQMLKYLYHPANGGRLYFYARHGQLRGSHCQSSCQGRPTRQVSS